MTDEYDHAVLSSGDHPDGPYPGGIMFGADVLKPGDRVLVHLLRQMSAEEVDRLAKGLAKRYPDVGFTFIDGAKVAVKVSEPDLDNWFTYHPPGEGDVEAYGHIRVSGRRLAEAIVAEVPPSRERDKALEAVREAVMWANAGRACNPASGG